MTETAAPTRFVTITRTEEHSGYENECFTHYVQDNGGRYCLRGRWFSKTRNGSRTAWTASRSNSPKKARTDSVRASLLYPYAGAGRSRIFIMISSAPSLYR